MHLSIDFYCLVGKYKAVLIGHTILILCQLSNGDIITVIFMTRKQGIPVGCISEEEGFSKMFCTGC